MQEIHKTMPACTYLFAILYKSMSDFCGAMNCRLKGINNPLFLQWEYINHMGPITEDC